METGNVPTIFILGAQKGGSSSLFEFMREHPQLCGARKKEPQFFSQLTGIIIQLLINQNKMILIFYSRICSW